MCLRDCVEIVEYHGANEGAASRERLVKSGYYSRFERPPCLVLSGKEQL